MANGKVKAYELQSKCVESQSYRSYSGTPCNVFSCKDPSRTWLSSSMISSASSSLCAFKKSHPLLRPNSLECSYLKFRLHSSKRFNAMFSSTVRKSIARVLTVMNHKARQNLREFYKDKKYLPLDLRSKKTRAIRRRLTPVRVFPFE